MTDKTPSSPQPLLIRVVSKLSDVCGVVAALMILCAVFITCQMVWARYINNESTVWQTEAVVYLMIGATLIGLPYVQRVRGHVNVDLLPRLLPQKFAKVLTLLTLASAIVVIGLMLFYGAELWLIAQQRGWRSDTVWGVPLWIPYLSMPLGFGLFALQLLADFIVVLLNYDAPTEVERRH